MALYSALLVGTFLFALGSYEVGPAGTNVLLGVALIAAGLAMIAARIASEFHRALGFRSADLVCRGANLVQMMAAVVGLVAIFF